MKTYPYTTPDGIIELVRKDEHDAVVRELNERLTKQQADMLDTIIGLRTQLAAIKTAAANAGFSEWLRKALAAYESAKSGNLPDPLAEAVKRMEAVPISYSPVTYVDVEAVRARLIQAAKGEQP